MATLIITKLVSFGLSKALAGALVNLGASLLLSTVSQLALQRSAGADLSREISAPRSLPFYRFAYGIGARIQGTGAPTAVVRNNVLYGCFILNSRPSAGTNFALYFDRRAVGLSGEPRDFGTVNSGTDTVAEGATYVTITHGLGTTPAADEVAGWNAAGPLTVAGITGTTFQIHLAAAAPPGGTAVSWRAIAPTDGGVALNAPFAGYVNIWLGLGDQQHPPARILKEVGDLSGVNPTKFWATDRWAGRTVLWVRLVAGAADTRADRWPSAPPLIEVECDWTPVWDPRDVAQDPDDPDTWRVSANQALCTLDAVLNNPIARYSRAQVRLDDFTAAADLADERVRLLSGATEARYRVGGLVVFGSGSELSDVLRPLEMAGAGSLFRAGGKIGYAPGAWEAPAITLGEYLREDGCKFQRSKPSRDLAGALKGVYPDRSANWERAETPVRAVDANWDGGDDRISGIDLDLVFSGTQAQRIVKIFAERQKLQRAVTATWPPVAITALPGARTMLALPRETDARNGTYRVTRSHPARWLDTDDGVAMHMPMTLEEDAEAVYAWDYATDEVQPFDQSLVPFDPTVPVPVWDSATVVSADLNLEVTCPGDIYEGEVVVFTPSVDSLEIRFRRNQEPFWLLGADLTIASDSVTATGTITSVLDQSSYDLGVRSVLGEAFSDWVDFGPVQVGFTLGAPTGTSAAAGTGDGEIDVAATAPSDTPCAAVQVWIGTTDDPAEAWNIDEIAAAPSAAVAATATGLVPGVLHYVFIRAVTSGGAVGPWATTLTATPT